MPRECPSRDDLRNYITGKLDDQQAEQLVQHLDDCPPCEETVANLEKSDTLLESLAQPVGDEAFLDEPQLSEALSAIKSPPATGSASDESHLDLDSDQSVTLGSYELLSKIGEGGMGAVYKALHTQLERVVALKILPKEKTKNEAMVQRFRREMKAVGRLHHENIVQATDAGEFEGTHFLVMEYVEGVDLSQLVKQNGPLPVAEACELVRRAAVGLQAAHEADMIHRDIKPSNLMLTQTGKVKILDLGLARVSEAVDDSELTGTGQVMGTIDYMAPEQGGSSRDVDIRADIYALGATLYKLLTGQAIFSGEKYSGPVQKMMALANETPPPVRQLRPEVPQPLSDLIARLLAKDPDQRSSTPAEVAKLFEAFAGDADLSRLVAAGEQAGSETAVSAETMPTQTVDPAAETAPRPSTAGTGHRRRIPPRIALAAGAAALLIVCGVVFFFQTPTGTLRVEINDPENMIEARVVGEDIIVNYKEKEGEPIRLSAGDHKLQIRRGDLEFTTDNFSLKRGDRVVLDVKLLDGQVKVVQDGETVIGQRDVEPTSSGTPVAFENYALSFDGEDDYVETPIQYQEGNPPFTVEASLIPKKVGGRAHAAVSSGQFWIRHHPHPWPDHGGRPVWAAVGSAGDGSGSKGVSTSWPVQPEQAAHVAAVWDRKELTLFVNGIRQASRPLNDGLQGNGYRFMIGAVPKGYGKEIHNHFDGVIDEVRFSNIARYGKDFTPTERFESDEHTLALYHFDEGSGDVLRDASGNGHHGKIVGATWVKESARDKFVPYDVYEPVTDVQLLGTLSGHKDEITSVAFSPDGKTLASASLDGTIRLWDAAMRKARATIKAHDAPVESVAFSPDGASLASTSKFDPDGGVKLWNPATGERKKVLPGASAHNHFSVAFQPDGDLLAVGSARVVKLWNFKQGTFVKELKNHDDYVPAVAFSPDGRRLASSSGRGTVKLWDAASGELERTINGDPDSSNRASLAFTPDGRTLAVVHGDRDFVALRDAATGELRRKLTAKSRLFGVALSPDGRLLAAGTTSDVVHLWDLSSGRLLESLRGHGDILISVAFSPDGTLLASAGRDKTVKLWRIEFAAERRVGQWQPTDEQQAFFDAVALQPVEKRFPAVLRKFQQVNPFYDPNPESEIRDGHVAKLTMADLPNLDSRAAVWRQATSLDLWPLAALTQLETLAAPITPDTDFGPLSALPLKTLDGVRLTPFHPRAEELVAALGELESLNGVAPAAWLKRKEEILELRKRAPAMSPEELRERFIEKLIEYNPGYKGPSKGGPAVARIADGTVRGVSVYNAQEIIDLSPVQALPRLETLACGHSVIDLSPLEGLKLELLHCGGRVSDLSPLKGMPLRELITDETFVSDLSPLKGMPLEKLHCFLTRVKDLSPLKGMPLKELDISHLPVSDLSPLEGMPLEKLNCKETRVADLSPLKGMPLKEMDCYGTRVSDLSPLKGMPLTFVGCGNTRVGDLAPLSGMELTLLNCDRTNVSDLSPLAEMPLTTLSFNATSVDDISMIDGMQITKLRLDETNVSDLSVIEGMPLVDLTCSKELANKHSSLLRKIETLKKINDKPAQEYLDSLD